MQTGLYRCSGKRKTGTCLPGTGEGRKADEQIKDRAQREFSAPGTFHYWPAFPAVYPAADCNQNFVIYENKFLIYAVFCINHHRMANIAS